jgi:hypothetical protein
MREAAAVLNWKRALCSLHTAVKPGTNDKAFRKQKSHINYKAHHNMKVDMTLETLTKTVDVLENITMET